MTLDSILNFVFSELERIERKYHHGELTATRMLDEASHFFDGWTVRTLDDEWNEMYGQYIAQIDDPRSAAGFDDLNAELPDVAVDLEEPRPGPPPPPPPNGNGNEVGRAFNGCSVCYGELNQDNWWIVRPCRHCFCEACVKVIFPPKRSDETFAEHVMRCQNCPTCRGHLYEVEKIFPNFVILTEGDHVLPVVHEDENQAAAAAAAVAAASLEEELEDDGAAVRRAENQRLVADLMHTNRHEGASAPSHNWDALQDEIGIEDFDDSQVSQGASQRPLPVIGSQRGRGRGRRGTRGGRGASKPRDRASVVADLDQRAQSILKKNKRPIGNNFKNMKLVIALLCTLI